MTNEVLTDTLGYGALYELNVRAVGMGQVGTEWENVPNLESGRNSDPMQRSGRDRSKGIR